MMKKYFAKKRKRKWKIIKNTDDKNDHYIVQNYNNNNCLDLSFERLKKTDMILGEYNFLEVCILNLNYFTVASLNPDEFTNNKKCREVCH